jgi:hypothetical protein
MDLLTGELVDVPVEGELVGLEKVKVKCPLAWGRAFGSKYSTSGTRSRLERIWSSTVAQRASSFTLMGESMLGKYCRGWNRPAGILNIPF